MIDWRPVLRRQQERFELRFGRKPNDGEPVLFDPNAEGDKPVNLDPANGFDLLLKICAESRFPGHVIHAIKITRAVPHHELPSGWDDALLTGWKLHGRKENSRCECELV